MRKLVVPWPLWCIVGTLGFGLSCFYFVGVFEGRLVATTGVEFWLGVAGGCLLVIWLFLRPRFRVERKETEGDALNLAASKRLAEGAPEPDPERLAKERQEAREKSQKTRKGPRWMRPPIVRRFGLKLPEE